MNLEGYDADRFGSLLESGQLGKSDEYALDLPQRWILSRLQRVAAEVDEGLLQ